MKMQKPIDFVVDVFKRKDIVFLSEDHAVKDNLLFVKQLIPYLHKAGVSFLGMEFGASEDQDILDKLVTGNSFSYKLARDLMFHYNVIFPYKEYMDLYKAVFDFNQTLKNGRKPFRILNLSYVYDWSDYTLPDTPKKREKVFHKGDTETYRFNLLKHKVVEQNQKILILTGTVHALTKYRYSDIPNNFFGQQVYDYRPDLTYTIQLHEYFRDITGKKISPCNGQIEELCKRFPEGCGFDLYDHELGQLETKSYYSIGYEELQLKDIFDGYIFLKPLDERFGCTVDCEFLNDYEFEDILKQFPDPNWHLPPKNLEEYWVFVKRYVDLKNRN